jgi:threonine dehydrogenase-like Zn-dependent dehydrogenase
MTLPELAARFGPIDLVCEAAGSSPLALAAVEALGPNGVILLLGVPGRRPPTPVDTDQLMRTLVLGNRVIAGSVSAGRGDYVAAIHLLESFLVSFPESLRGLVTGRFPLEETPALLAGRGGGIKDVVRIGGA